MVTFQIYYLMEYVDTLHKIVYYLISAVLFSLTKTKYCCKPTKVHHGLMDTLI